ncbi:MAG: hypothetical protein QOG46_1014, partial [Pseudonocardiales bacterium]|nr:hypothetical protein [Pseudonocardiales bacterium]
MRRVYRRCMREDPVSSTAGNVDPDLPEQDDGSVGMLELFFDLVFVFTMSQVTSLMSADVSWLGFGHGALALAAIWWAWVCYTWLTATADEAGPLTQTVIFLAMTAMLIAAVALPKAFAEHALIFGLAYLCVRLLHVVLFVRLGRRNAELRAALVRLIPTLVTGPALVMVAAFTDPPYRELLWLVGGIVYFA